MMRAWSLLLVAALMGGCAINPVSGRPEFVVISAAKERELGAREAKNVERAMGIVTDAELSDYVTRIGDRLAKFSPWQEVVYTFHVVDMKEPNAFALPGGFVYVTRGLLALVNTEDELACVIGHEIGHVAARHAVQRISRAVPMAPIAVVTGLAGAITSIVSPTVGDALAGSGILAMQAVLAPYGRSQENEADKIGQQLAAQAGYDPKGITQFFETLDREVTYMLGEERRPSFFDTHPATPQRVRKTSERAGTLERGEGRPFAATRAAFLGELEGIVVGPDPAQGLFDGALFVQPELGFSLRFPEGWRAQNTPSFVLAQAPEEAALLTLQIASRGSDPVETARTFAQEVDPSMASSIETTRIGGLPAARATTNLRGHGLDLTFIAHGGYVYLITGASPRRSFEDYRATFRAASSSFRPLSAAQLAEVRESRLRVRRGRAGEAVDQFVRRTGASWSPEQLAIANAIEDGARLESGQLLKVALPQPYTRRGR